MSVLKMIRPWAFSTTWRAVILGMTAMTLCAPTNAFAATPSITNGSFESIGTNTASYLLAPGNGAVLPGWTVTPNASGNGWACVVAGGVNNLCGYSFTVFPGTSPSGGNFLASDANSSYAQTISQTINNLTVGTRYNISFYQAGAVDPRFVVHAPKTLRAVPVGRPTEAEPDASPVPTGWRGYH